MVSSSEHKKEDNGDTENAVTRSSLSLRAGLKKPLFKHRYYLDIKNHLVSSKVETKIKGLGGNIDLFLDKDVTHVITDREVCIGKGGIVSPRTPQQPNSNQSTSNNGSLDRTPNHVRPKTRVSAMLEKARSTPTHVEKDIFAEADKLGITVWTIEKSNIWLDKVAASIRTNKQRKVHEFKTPYIKFESFDRFNRPVFRELRHFPLLNLRGDCGDVGVVSRSTPPPPPSPPPPPPVLPASRNMTRKSGRAGINNTTTLVTTRTTSAALAAAAATVLAATVAGYCELCREEFGNQEEHLHGDKHQAFVSDTGNYIQLDELIADGGGGLDAFLKLNTYKDNGKLQVISKMPRTRTSSLSDKVKNSPLSPTGSDYGVKGRPRRHAALMNNYLEISIDDEKPEGARETRELRSSHRNALLKIAEVESDTWNSGRPKRSCIRHKRISADERLVTDNRTYYKVEMMSTKLRSSALGSTTTTATAITTRDSEHTSHTRRLHTPIVEELELPTQVQVTPPSRGSVATKATAQETTTGVSSEDGKSLVVKFKRMRTSELKQLNNEADNFLFPRKDDSSSEEDLDDNCPNTTASSTRGMENSVVISSEDEVEEVVDDVRNSPKNNNKTADLTKDETVDDEHSMDSNWSECSAMKKQRKRRTQAEAFITDNQKYYKFETPGSRLRYQGTFMSSQQLATEQSIPPPPSNMPPRRNNGETCETISVSSSVSPEEETVTEATSAKKETTAEDVDKLNFNDLKFSFEQKPQSEPWYNTFRRQDEGLEYYTCFSDSGCWKPLLLPYQLPPIPPLDPRHCYEIYSSVKRQLLEESGCLSTPVSGTPSCCTPDDGGGSSSASCVSNPSGRPSPVDLHEDTSNGGGEGSKTSDESAFRGKKCDKKYDKVDENGGLEDSGTSSLHKERRRRRRKGILVASKNPRKSPRQHASTLAILSTFIQQRKRRDLNKSLSKSDLDDSKTYSPDDLPVIPEEHPFLSCADDDTDVKSKEYVKLERTHLEMDRLLSETDMGDMGDLQLDIQGNENLLSAKYKTDAVAILEDYEKYKDVDSKTGLSVGTNKRSYSPGKKPGRKRKKKRKNMTGWPNKNKRIITSVKKEIDDSTIDSLSVNADSEDLDENTMLCGSPPKNDEDTKLTGGGDVSKLDRTEDLDENTTLCPLSPNNDEDNDCDSDNDTTINTTINNGRHLDSNKTTCTNVRLNTDTSSIVVVNNNNRLTNATTTTTSINTESSAMDIDESADETISDSVVNNKDRVVDLECWENAEKVLSAKLSNDTEKVLGAKLSVDTVNNGLSSEFQPVVRVRKLADDQLKLQNNRRLRSSVSPPPQQSAVEPVTPTSQEMVSPQPQQQRSVTGAKRARRMPASPKSPRVLRKPRGRWYRER